WFTGRLRNVNLVPQVCRRPVYSPPRRRGEDATSIKYREGPFKGADGVVRAGIRFGRASIEASPCRARAPRHPSSARRGMVSSPADEFISKARADSINPFPGAHGLNHHSGRVTSEVFV